MKSKLIIFLSSLILLLYFPNACLPIMLCMLFMMTLKGEEIVVPLIIFSIIFDAYTNRIVGVSGCMLLTLYLLMRKHVSVLRRDAIGWRIYYFTMFLFYAEVTGICFGYLFRQNIEMFPHFIEMIFALFLYIFINIGRHAEAK